MQTSVVIFLDQEDNPNVYRYYTRVNLGFDVLINEVANTTSHQYIGYP